MTDETFLKPRPATALIALTRAMMLDEAVDDEAVKTVTGAVCESASERVALLSALHTANSHEIRMAVSNILSEHAADLHAEAAGLTDLDEVAGVWGSRLVTGGLLLAAGALLTESLTGVPGGLALLTAFAGAIGLAAARMSVRKRRNTLDRQYEIAAKLAEDALNTRKEG